MPVVTVADLTGFIPNLQREVNPPGSDNFPAATDDDWIGSLIDGFWEARLDGFLQGYTCDENGLIAAVTAGNANLPNPAQPTQASNLMNWSADGQVRELVQLVLFYAGYRIIRNTLRATQTAFRAQAGAVSFETQNSAQLLQAVLRDLVSRRDILLRRLSDLGFIQDYLIDAVSARNDALTSGDTYFVGTGDGYQAYGYQ